VHQLDPVQLRVLGCLLEKQRTTPDQYPLSLNALRLACNQATNRDPVLDLDESTVREAVQRLGTIGWSRLASGPGSRAAKYRQLFDEALGLLPSETALLAVLMLRGPQTAAELRTRSERLHHFASVPDVEATLDRLAERELVQRQERRPGTREERWVHQLGVGSPEPTGITSSSDDGVMPSSGRDDLSLLERLARVEERLTELERALAPRDPDEGRV
jgi:uncharacterized protein YceH (UPF0502 family)